MKPSSDHRSLTSTQRNIVSDGLNNYTILKQLGKGSQAVIHLAVCKRGRLRDRQVAIKVIPKHSDVAGPASASLHQSLHHPTIVSLLSSFSADASHYHVLELCSRGSLSSFLPSRDHPACSESETRGVLKSLVEALQYLRKERVIHCNINPSSIFITESYRIKLGNFELAKRLPAEKSITDILPRLPTYPSPEIVSRSPYTFTADLWSLGCLAIYCLSGHHSHKVHELSESCSFKVEHTLPKSISAEARDLVVGLLQMDPTRRIQLQSIISHTFFDSALPIHSLDPDTRIREASIDDRQFSSDRTGDPSRSEQACFPPFPSKLSFSRNRGSHSESGSIGGRKMPGNRTDLRCLLNNEIRQPGRCIGPRGITRRVVSDPLPRNPRASNAELRACTPQSVSVATPPSSVGSGPSPKEKMPVKLFNMNPRPMPHLATYVKNAARVHTVSSSLRSGPCKALVSKEDAANAGPVTSVEHSCSSPATLGKRFRQSHPSRIPRTPTAVVPIGTVQPTPFTTHLLKAQTCKSVHGQITILPSRSLLVDFREGERRRGKKGNEVFIVDPTGVEVKVYSAPHLSTPCCLTETVAIYSTDKLPPQYWKSYSDAKHLIEQLKQRTPMLVMYTAEGKCTLMSNTPLGDIELLFRDPERNASRGKKTAQTEQTSMRIRLSRDKHSVEIARHIPGAWGGEWTKKILFATWTAGHGVGIPDSDLKGLQVQEKEGIERLAKFLSICEAVECLSATDTGFQGPKSGSLPETGTHVGSAHLISGVTQVAPFAATGDVQGPVITQTTATNPLRCSLVESLRTVKIEPRPGKSPRSDPAETNFQSQGTMRVLPDEFHSTERANVKIQTRFIPALGWCIRYGSKDSQEGGYRIMFLDGVILDVDVDEEYVEYRDQSGQLERLPIRECNSEQKIWERMKVFEEFVSLFESPSGLVE